MKKVISLTVSVLFCCVLPVHAQDTKKEPDTKTIAAKAADVSALTKNDTNKKHWDVGGLVNVAFSQVSFTNWAAGGQNSLGLTSLASLHANYKCGKFKWLNDAQLGYGFQRLGDLKPQKTTDQIAVTSNAGYRMFDHMLLSALANLQTQFQPGYLFPNADSVVISKFFAPAYLVLALGATYAPNKWFSAFLSPATARITFVEDQKLADAGSFGVKPAVYDASGKKVTNGAHELTQVGAYFKANFSKEVVKNITVTSSIELFSNYIKNPQNIVVNWVTFIQCKVNKYISATINTQLIYDDNVAIPIYRVENGTNTLVGKGPRLQFKDVLGIGFAYNL